MTMVKRVGDLEKLRCVAMRCCFSSCSVNTSSTMQQHYMRSYTIRCLHCTQTERATKREDDDEHEDEVYPFYEQDRAGYWILSDSGYIHLISIAISIGDVAERAQGIHDNHHITLSLFFNIFLPRTLLYKLFLSSPPSIKVLSWAHPSA